MIRVSRTTFADISDDLQADLMARQGAVDDGAIDPRIAWIEFEKIERQGLNTALQADFHYKCAYCETGLDEESADIEHFWPKAPHIHNAKRGTPFSETALLDGAARQNGQHGVFVWANLLWGCKTCNGWGCKGTHLIWNDAGQTMLLNPCRAEDDPYDYISFGTDGLEAGRVYPKPGISANAFGRAEYTIKRFKLRKRDLLVKERAGRIRQFLELIAHFHQFGSTVPGPSGVTIGERLEQMLNAETTFLAPIRQILFDPAFAAPGYPSLYAELRTSIAGIDYLLAGWNAFPQAQ